MSDIQQLVIDNLAEQLEVSADNIRPEHHLVNDLGADSLDLVESMMALEDQFDCLINTEDLDVFRTVGDVVQWLEKHTASNRS